MARTLEEATDESERQVIHDVTEFGWHIVYILADDEGPAFGFTIGLPTTLNQPELIIVGQRQEVAHIVLNNLGFDIQSGKKFGHGDRSSDVFEGFHCAFVDVDPSHYRDWMGFACWWHRGSKFTTLQVVWPDKQDRLPWDDGANPVMRQQQPILGKVPR